MHMNYEDAKALHTAHYPGLYLDEESFLHHVFYIAGSGWRWIEGKLICIQPINTERYPKRTPEEVAELQARYPKDGPGRFLYPVSGYSNIMNIPDDVQPDWKAAAEKAKEMVFSGLYAGTPEDLKQLRQEK